MVVTVEDHAKHASFFSCLQIKGRNKLNSIVQYNSVTKIFNTWNTTINKKIK